MSGGTTYGVGRTCLTRYFPATPTTPREPIASLFHYFFSTLKMKTKEALPDEGLLCI